jgi:imidazolonepropionase-like amidohydrolase
MILANCRVLNVVNGVIEPKWISIQNQRILAIESPQTAEPADEHHVIYDMGGAYAIPGLIDLHQHVCASPDPGADTYLGIGDTDAAFRTVAQRNLGECLAAGVTTVRDVGSYQGRAILLGRAVAAGEISGPSIHACGPLITYPGGHGSALGVEISEPGEAEQAVQLNIEAGADFVKIASDPEDAEAQSRTPNPAFSEEMLREIVDAAHASHLKVACHTFPSREGVCRALAAGVDTLEHAAPLDDASLQMVIDSNAVLVPTVVAAADEFLPTEIAELIGMSEDGWYELSKLNYPPDQLRGSRPQAPPSIITWLERLVDYLPSAIAAGATIGIGTDAGCSGTNFRSAVREMHLLMTLGATPLQVLQYATLNGAVALGRSDVGALVEGSLADIVFLNQNPLENLSTLCEPKAVLARGAWVAEAPPRVDGDLWSAALTVLD